MKPLESYEKEATTTGRFIQVHFKVENKGKKEGILGGGPTGKLVDGTGREFGTMERQSSFIPKGAETMVFEKIQPSMSKEFYAVYEVPPGADKLSFKATDFGLFGKDKTIPLGDIAPAPPAPVAAASAAAPAAKAAAPAAKAAATTTATRRCLGREGEGRARDPPPRSSYFSSSRPSARPAGRSGWSRPRRHR